MLSEGINMLSEGIYVLSEGITICWRECSLKGLRLSEVIIFLKELSIYKGSYTFW